MLKYFLLGCAVATAIHCTGQARMVMNNDVYMVMNNGVYLVVDNSNSNAISSIGTGGNIISEDEFNIVKWNIGTVTGNYIIPFTTLSGIKIPLSININTPGAGSGNVQISTYGGPDWDNDGYRPTGVTNMTNMGVTNNSSEVIDRFWMIDAQGYTTKPGGDIQFNYDDAEHLAVGNTITESELRAERYDEPTDNWELFPVGGTVNTTSNYVAGVAFNSSDFTRTWTLIDQTTHLLPLVLVSYEVECVMNNAVITWQTLQEINTDHFILEWSEDGDQFNYLADIPASGNTIAQSDYAYVVENAAATYYRLTLINADGTSEELGVEGANCSIQSSYYVNIFASGPQEVTFQMSGLAEGDYRIVMTDLQGKIVADEQIYVNDGLNIFQLIDPRLAAGLYATTIYSTQSSKPFQFSKLVPLVHLGN